LHWTDHSRTFWSLLNGTPVAELRVPAYDEDYPAHEWVALHIQQQAAAAAATRSGSATTNKSSAHAGV